MGVDLGPGARGCVRICATLFARFICAFGLARTCLRIRRIRPGTVGRTRPAPLIGRIRPSPARRSGPDSHRPARRDAATLVRVGRTGRAWHCSVPRVCKLLGHHIATQPVAWPRLAPPRASRCCDPCPRRPDRQGLAFRLGPESLQAPWPPHSHPAGRMRCNPLQSPARVGWAGRPVPVFCTLAAPAARIQSRCPIQVIR